jgi:transcriptional regulator with XRE-family HTH domain
MISGDQVRAARRLLGWTLFQAAVRAKVSESTVGKFETGAHRPLDLRIIAIQRAFEAAGVEFIPNGPAGVRLKGVASGQTDMTEPSKVA